MGLDVGDRRVGIAVSDEAGTVAQGRGVYRRRGSEADLDALAELCRREKADRFVVGLPLHMHGGEGEEAHKVRAFGQALAGKTGLPVDYIDERLTTVEADRVLAQAGQHAAKRRQVRDELSAILILQAWLDRRRWQGRP
ncbi:MAG: Holliday junction resolvase RuvX [Candidatus Bipolaricaulaceae bacterium]